MTQSPAPEPPEPFGPPAPLRLFTWRFVHPIHNQWVTLDSAATTRDEAFRRATRFVDRLNRRLRAAGAPTIRGLNHENALTLEMPTWPCP